MRGEGEGIMIKDLKILSIKENQSGGDNVLIPCYMYEITMIETYNGSNILESTIAEKSK